MRALLGVITLVVAFFGSATAAEAWCQMTTSRMAPTISMPCVTDGVPLAWTRRCIGYAIDGRDSLDLSLDQITEAVERSFASWTSVRCDGVPIDLEVSALGNSLCRDARFSERGGNVNTIAFVENWRERKLDPSAFALTTVWHNQRTGEILDADMQLNEQLGPWAICPENGCPEGARVVDLQNVLTHEIGHFFGMGHSEVNVATMAPTSTRGETSKRVLRTDDIEGFCTIYPPGSLPAACDPTPNGGLALDCETKSSSRGCAASPVTDDEPMGRTLLFTSLGLIALGLFARRRRRSPAFR